VVVAHRQFSDVEFEAVTSVFDREGARWRVAGTALQPAVGIDGTIVRPTLLLGDLRAESCDALVFVGGNGARDYWAHPRVHNLVRAMHDRGRLLAAICIAPVIFARSGLLKGRASSCHPSVRRDLESCGAQYLLAPVHVEHAVVTANGPAAALDFAEAIVNQLAPPPQPGA
jgi:protease I